MALSLEKTIVVRQMLSHYNRVSEEFYTEYSGRHMNRDSVYTQPDSFSAGKYPRPLVLIFVEWLFIALFRLLWNFGVVANWAKKNFGSKKISKKEKGSVPKPPVSGPSKGVKAKQDAIDFSNKNQLSVVEMDDVEIGEQEQLIAADETTETTGASSDNTIETNRQTFGDCNLSHTLAKGFMSAVYCQCRMESHARAFASSCLKSAPTFAGGPKRKNSSMDKFLEETGSDSDPDESPSSSDGKKIVRRNQPTLDVY